MYLEAYEFIKEVLDDEALNKWIIDKTGKALTVIDSGPQVTTPAAGILFRGEDFGQIADRSAVYRCGYDVIFALPFWGADGMRLCHEFIDVAIDAFMSNRRASNVEGRNNYVTKIYPTLVEDDAEQQWWTIGLRVYVSIFTD